MKNFEYIIIFRLPHGFLTNIFFIHIGFYSDLDWDDGKFHKPKNIKLLIKWNSRLLKYYIYLLRNCLTGSVISGPPQKRLTKDNPLINRTTPEQYAPIIQSNLMPSQTLPRHIAQINGKPKIPHMTRIGSGRKQVISWMDAPDDVYFRATENSKYVIGDSLNY